MNFAVRCPECAALSRVPFAAAGREVGCPSCGSTFPADPPPAPAVPVARPLARPAADVPTVYPAEHAHRHHDQPGPPRGPASALVGLALLPFAIPLLWFLGPTLTGKEPVFTPMVPAAVALAAAGLSLGAVLASDWRFGTRVKGVLAVVAVGYATAALLYFLEPGWVEGLRRNQAGPPPNLWKDFTPEGEKYTARLPGLPKPDPGEVLAGWPLRAYRYADRRRHADTFIVAQGPAPAAVRGQADDPFLTAAAAAAASAVSGTLVSEQPTQHRLQPARRCVIALPDKATTRTVLLVRVGETAYVAAVEGPFLPPDAREVEAFFRDFLPPARK